MRTTRPIALRARPPGPPEPDLTFMAVAHRAMRRDLGRLAACLGQVADRGAKPAQACVMSAGTVSTLTHVTVISGVIVGLLGAALFARIARSCQSGRNWARVTASALVVLGGLAAVYDLVSPRAAAVTVVSFVVCLIGLAAVVLLWRGSSSAYFKLLTRPQL